MQMKIFTKQSSFGLPTHTTKMGEDQKGPAAYIVEKSKYKSLLGGAIMMIVSFGFLYMAFSSERGSHMQHSTFLYATEEHQRVEKQNAEMKLLQITQVLTSHLELEQEEESEMKMLYVKMLNAEASGNEKLQKLLPEGEQKATVLAAFAEIMDDVTAVVGTHERESRKRGAHARALLTHIHDDIIHELEREAAGESAVPVAANDRAQSAHTREAVDAQLGYLQA